MKNLLKAATVASLLTTSALNADFLRVEAGAGMWLADPSGDISLKDNSINLVDTLGYSTSSSTYAWILFKHFVPVIPNARLEYVALSYDGKIATGIPAWNNSPVPDKVSNSLSLNEYDAILYYNILDNTFWTTVDFGLDVKMIDASFQIDPLTIVGQEAYAGYKTPSAMIPLPLGYARARVEVPFTGLGVEAIGEYLSLGESKVMDVRAKVDYTLGITPLIQPGIELGYRMQKFDVDATNIKSSMPVLNLEFSGFYAGAMLRF